MNYSIYRISLDIHDISAPIALTLKSEDTCRRIVATLSEKGQPYEISDDCFAQFVAQLPNGSIVVDDCSVSENTIIYDMTESVSALAGTVKCEFMLEDSAGRKLTTPRFMLVVDKSIGGERA